MKIYENGTQTTSSNVNKTVITNLSISPGQGAIPLYLKMTVSTGDSGDGKGKCYINSSGNGTITLIGRTVVG